MSKAIEDVIAERERQIKREGWTAAHDDEHTHGEMAQAAVCYVVQDAENLPKRIILDYWPWALCWWKPKDQRRNLVIAAALLIAEIDRLDRAAVSATGES